MNRLDQIETAIDATRKFTTDKFKKAELAEMYCDIWKIRDEMRKGFEVGEKIEELQLQLDGFKS